MWNIILVVLLAFVIYKLCQTQNSSLEGFNNDPFNQIIGQQFHLKLDGHGKPQYYSYQSPTANGELGCTVVPCPNDVGPNVTCWCCCNYH